MAATEEEPKPKKLKVEAPRALSPGAEWCPRCRHGAKAHDRQFTELPSMLRPFAQRPPSLAELPPAPERLRLLLANQDAGLGRKIRPRARCGRHVGASPGRGWWHFGRPDPTRAECRAATFYSLGDKEVEVQRLLCPGAKKEFLGIFRTVSRKGALTFLFVLTLKVDIFEGHLQAWRVDIGLNR